MENLINEKIQEANFEIAIGIEELESYGWDFTEDDWMERYDKEELEEFCAVISIRGAKDNLSTYIRFEKWVDLGSISRGQDEDTGDNEQTIEDVVSILSDWKKEGIHFPNSSIRDHSNDEYNCYLPLFNGFQTQKIA